MPDFKVGVEINITGMYYVHVSAENKEDAMEKVDGDLEFYVPLSKAIDNCDVELIVQDCIKG